MNERIVSTAVLATALALGGALTTACGPRDPGEVAGADGDYEDRVAAEHEGDSPIPAAAGEAIEEVEVTARPVAYATVAGREVTGYLAQPAGAETRRDDELPGLIVIHEWWGLNENIETTARMLAQNGYKVLAVDLYGGAVAEDLENARRLVQEVDEAEAEDNLRQAHAYLAGDLRSPRVGVIGWCFGGGWSLRSALLLGEAVDAAVVFYGQPITDPQRLAALEAPLLGIFGGQDSSIPVADVRRLESTLRELGKTAEVHVYEEAGHAFANPSGERYVPEAARQAWEETLAFLGEHLEGGAAGTPATEGAGTG